MKNILRVYTLHKFDQLTGAKTSKQSPQLLKDDRLSELSVAPTSTLCVCVCIQGVNLTVVD